MEVKVKKQTEKMEVNQVKQTVKMESKVKVKVYQIEGNTGSIETCYLKDLSNTLKKMYQYNNENQIYGVQVVLPKEKLISDWITCYDVYRMSANDFQNLQADTDLQDELISILIGMKLKGKEDEIENIVPLFDIWEIQGRRDSEGHDVGGFEEDIYAEYIKVADKYLNK